MSKFPFVEVKILRDGEDEMVIVPITACDKPSGARVFSFSFQKEYSDDGIERKRTCWLARRHIPAMRRMLDQIEQTLMLEEEKARIKR